MEIITPPASVLLSKNHFNLILVIVKTWQNKYILANIFFFIKILFSEHIDLFQFSKSENWTIQVATTRSIIYIFQVGLFFANNNNLSPLKTSQPIGLMPSWNSDWRIQLDCFEVLSWNYQTVQVLKSIFRRLWYRDFRHVAFSREKTRKSDREKVKPEVVVFSQKK